ncbi:hypothetical protein [Streptomyces sp. NPDC002573]
MTAFISWASSAVVQSWMVVSRPQRAMEAKGPLPWIQVARGQMHLA